MQEDFVDIYNVKYQSDPIKAFEDFSKYVQKYKHFILTDERDFESGTTRYENGAEFIASVTQNINGADTIVITPNDQTKYEAAMHYLFVSHEVEYSISDIKISEIQTTSNVVVIDLFDNLQLDRNELSDMFSLELIPQDDNYSSQSLMSKFNSIEIKALKGVLNSENELEKDENGELILVDATDEFLITNPKERDVYDPTNPIWEIQSQNIQTNPNDGLRFRFEIVDDNQTYFSDVILSVYESRVERVNFNLNFNEMAVNQKLNDNAREIKTYEIKPQDIVLESNGDVPS
jgi:hypothetical protein